MNPAKRIIELFGGVRPLARELDTDPSVVCRWALPKERRGQGGLIPAEYQGRILKLAKRKQLQVSAEDLIAK